MSTINLLYIILAVLISTAIAFFQYFFNVNKRPRVNFLLFTLKALSLFFIGLLLINPKIEHSKTQNIKPNLSVLIDNSFSIKFFKEEKTVNDFIKKVRKNTALHKKFDIDFFSFGKQTAVLDSLLFNKSHTDIYNAVKTVDKLQKEKLGTIILLTDGNQTIGNDYEFLSSKKAIHSVVLGDTTKYQDVRISQLNVNKYSYIKNKFPVEARLFYNGNKNITTTFTITKDGKKVFSEKVSFSKKQNTKTIIANLTSIKEGVQFYTARVGEIKKEKNTKNNYKSFSVEVINEQTKVLILSSILHPDLGALKKAIETNKQRTVDIKLIQDFTKEKINDYQFVIFYQPNAYFKSVLEQRKSNYLFISGVKTDWNFINQQKLLFTKDAINQSEDYQANYNANFVTFSQKNIGFNNFPPLKDKFGIIETKADTQILLSQKILNTPTKQPLVATLESGEQKIGVIFGEGIWKWRSASYLQEQSFEQFDSFIGNLVQFLSSTKKRKRLTVNAERLYPANSTIEISALYLDKNYKFDDRASLQITITNQQTKEQKIIPMSLVNTVYKTNLEGLNGGNYTYKVSVKGQKVNSYGSFKVESYNIEEQFTNANILKLSKLSNASKGGLFFKNQEQLLFKKLLEDKTLYTKQKYLVKQENLIHWKWMLFLIVGLLTLEWFIRKYHGKI